MPVPVLVFQIRVSVKDHKTALSFEIPHKLRYAYLQRYRYKHMYMVRAYFCRYYIYSFPLAQLSKYCSYFQPLFLKENLSAVLGGKDYMILAIPLCV